MTSSETFYFDDLCEGSQPIDLSVTLGLLWMSVCDGGITPKEQKRLTDYYESAPGSEIFQDPNFKRRAIAAIKNEESDVIERMCEILKGDLNADEQRYFFHLLISMSCANDTISVPKNYILHFFLDLFEIDLDYLNKEYLSLAGELLPEPGDPSSLLWWEFEDSINNATGEGMSHYRENLSEAQARQILGLENSTASSITAKEIKMAYRRLAQHYHPDRHEGLDDSKRHKAEQSFLLIQKAYEVLKG